MNISALLMLGLFTLWAWRAQKARLLSLVMWVVLAYLTFQPHPDVSGWLFMVILSYIAGYLDTRWLAEHQAEANTGTVQSGSEAPGLSSDSGYPADLRQDIQEHLV